MVPEIPPMAMPLMSEEAKKTLEIVWCTFAFKRLFFLFFFDFVGDEFYFLGIQFC
jgi:hypothetical protein